MTTMHEAHARFIAERQSEANELFVGKQIAAVRLEGAFERISTLTLEFTDGSRAKIDYWASYSDDDSLEFAREP